MERYARGYKAEEINNNNNNVVALERDTSINNNNLDSHKKTRTETTKDVIQIAADKAKSAVQITSDTAERVIGKAEEEYTVAKVKTLSAWEIFLQKAVEAKTNIFLAAESAANTIKETSILAYDKSQEYLHEGVESAKEIAHEASVAARRYSLEAATALELGFYQGRETFKRNARYLSYSMNREVEQVTRPALPPVVELAPQETIQTTKLEDIKEPEPERVSEDKSELIKASLQAKILEAKKNLKNSPSVAHHNASESIRSK